MGTLFADMLVQADVDTMSASTRSAITFKYWFTEVDATSSPVALKSFTDDTQGAASPATCTVLVSKNTGRYRVQSAVLPALWLVASELCNRLEKRWMSKDGGIKLRYRDPLPLSDFYAAVDNHHAARVAVRSSESLLNDICHQFRIIQKRLLVRFKDSRPAPIHHLDTLMQQSYDSVLKFGSAVEQAQVERTRCSSILSCSTSLVALLIRLRFSLSSEELSEISSHLHTDTVAHNLTTHEDSLAGWEEITDASLTFMLKNSLSRPRPAVSSTVLSYPINKSGVFTSTPPTALSFPLTTEKLKRRIALMCDRLDRIAFD